MRVVIGALVDDHSRQHIDPWLRATEGAIRCAQKTDQNDDERQLAFEIHLLDDSSTCEHDFTNSTRLVRKSGTETLGPFRKHNRLMREGFEGGADAYVMMDVDGRPEINCLSELLRTATASEDVGLVEAVQFPTEHPKPWSKEDYTTPWCSSTCMLVTRKAYFATHGFDDNFDTRIGDVDLSWRLRNKGYRLAVNPAALFFYDARRKTDEGVCREMLLAGRYLAVKWSSPPFRSWTEKWLVTDGFFPDEDSLPPIPEPPETFAQNPIAEFDYGFYFADARWLAEPNRPEFFVPTAEQKRRRPSQKATHSLVPPNEGVVLNPSCDLAASDGFHGLEHDKSKYQWTGPGREFTFTLHINRHEDREFRIWFADTLAPENRGGMECFTETDIPLDVIRGHDGRRFGFVGTLPARRWSGPTRITFCAKRAVRIRDVNPDSRDLRSLGVAFHRLEIDPCAAGPAQ